MGTPFTTTSGIRSVSTPLARSYWNLERQKPKIKHRFELEEEVNLTVWQTLFFCCIHRYGKAFKLEYFILVNLRCQPTYMTHMTRVTYQYHACLLVCITCICIMKVCITCQQVSRVDMYHVSVCIT